MKNKLSRSRFIQREEFRAAPQIFPPFHASSHLDRAEMSTPANRLNNFITKPFFHSHFRDDYQKVSPQIKFLVFSVTGYFALILYVFTPDARGQI